MIRWTFRCKCDYSGTQLDNFLAQIRNEACNNDISGQIIGNEGNVHIVAEGVEGNVEALINSTIRPDHGTGSPLTLLIEYEIERHYSDFREFSEQIGFDGC
jgi:acylphosphatase